MTDGRPRVQGITYTELAEEFGTPLYVYDEGVLAAQYGTLRRALHPKLEYFYSLKANPNISVLAALASRGARAEVCSAAELLTALRAGVDPGDIIFVGPGKSRTELTAALEHGIHAVVCESFDELALLDGLARARDTRAPVILRVNPAFSVKGSRLTMGGRPRQFGMDEEQLLARPGLAKEFPATRIIGVQAYMGTRILDAAVVTENTRRIFELAERVGAELDIPLRTVDVGGGLGIPYFDGEEELDTAELAAGLNPVVEEFHTRHPQTRLIMELGRYLTAPAGVYLVRVRYLKTSRGENFAVVDGGTHHHMAAVGIGSFVKRNFPMRLLSRETSGEPVPWQVTGPLCTPNDTLGKNVPLPPLRTGDLIGVLRSGAYGPTASPVQFLSHGYPAEVLVRDGRPHLVRERDRPEDLLARQHLIGP
ncbi:diaminopimelate decarboxylase [Streptomyces thermolilacinus]|uniref:Diaminopimelate decarboxylase n=1 Tax=Streptomyces thermolilacinus SPC6 TaxID=1306406 RepID=A0A1D3DYC8_9ACTN|nr:diaminopimelate decarboxylase [Streptomyces thermolilacinus]OEJ97333.1 diaminopimelate decarboxylase [Streptomyces thermolilacinus SPC6]